MKNRKDREKFEIYLQTIGRDISVYKSEGWTEVGFQRSLIGSLKLSSDWPDDKLIRSWKPCKVKCIEYGY